MKIAIIGAGLAGLTAAWEFASRNEGHEIDVYEAEGRIGGKLYTVPFNDGPTDMGAEAFLARNAEVVDFFTQLGLADSFVSPSGLSPLVYVDSKLQSLPSGGMMGIPSSSATIAPLVSEETAKRIDNEEPFEWEIGGDVSVGKLVRQQFGDDVVDHVVSALLGGVYSCTADDLGLRATIPALAATLDKFAADGPVKLSDAVRAMEQARPRTPGKGAPFQTFRGGYAEVYEALAEQSGADIHLDSFISGVTRESEGFRVKGAPNEAGLYDRVLFATPAPTTARLLPALSPAAAAALKKVKLAGSVVVGFKFDSDTDPEGNRLPDNTGILVGTDQEGVNAKAFTLSSRKWPHLAERGGALVRASFGRYGDDALLRAEEDQLVDYALDDLQHITGFDGRAAGVSEIFTQRWFGGIPRYDETHLATVAAAHAALADVPGIEATGAWSGGVGVPAVIADARAAAQRLLA